jgi:hypothetical protein
MTDTNALEPVKRMSRDVGLAAIHLSDQEARYLVDYYYICQEDRKRANNQERALGETGEPNAVVMWLGDQAETLEAQVKRALDKYTDAHPVGKWLKSIHGIGPVIAAGLLAHIDITKAPTAGHIWRYAGLDPTQKWEKGQRRPWNATLKTLCWKVGQSFMKFSNDENCFYGRIYRERKAYEIARNETGTNTIPAANWARGMERYAAGNLPLPDHMTTSSVERALGRRGKTTESYAWLAGCYDPAKVRELRQADNLTQGTLAKIKGEPGSGTRMLPPAQIDARARRYAVKLFLSHLQEVWFEQHFGTRPPFPYPIAILGDAHYIPPSAGASHPPSSQA